MITTNTTFAPMPTHFKKSGGCPTCGAAIYIDADLVTTANGEEILSGLPTPYFTCSCRLNIQLQLQPLPIVPAIPWVPGNPGDTGWPTSPWREPQTGDPLPWRGNTFCREDGSIDWSKFTGSGSATQDPDMKVICILLARTKSSTSPPKPKFPENRVFYNEQPIETYRPWWKLW